MPHGPTTPEGRARALANLTGDPEQAAIKHGVYRFLGRALAPPCDRCVVRDACERFEAGATCAVAEEYQAGLLADLRALEHVAPQDDVLLAEFARWATAAAIADHYLSVVGPFGARGGKLEGQPLLRLRLTISSRLQALAQELGLSPAARARLRAGTDHGAQAELARAFLELAQREAEASGEVPVEGEFERVAEEGGNDH